jgi:hypothetical protein
MSYKGSCLCKSVQFEIDGDFDNFFLCHCSHCRKGTGTVHGANLFSSSAKLNWQAGQELVKKYKLPSTHHTKSFCNNCGSALPFSQPEFNLVVVPAGSLDDKINIQPTAHIFTASKSEWEESLKDAPRFENLPS